MPDTTQTPTQTEPPAAEDGWRPDLGALRARLDEIDDKIHDLLIDRARVVEGVARSGKTAAFRPGREASILRRLLSRHTGKLPARTLVRMWREMLAGTTGMQAPIRVAVAGTGDVAEIAREHFGFLTPVIAHASIEAAFADVRSGHAAVAVLPLPLSPATWAALTAETPRLYVVARLPFWVDRPAHVPMADALVVATTAPDPSGQDRSFVMIGGAVTEQPGMVTEDDPALPQGAIVLGGYAVPVEGEGA